jgi:hypothetical protein
MGGGNNPDADGQFVKAPILNVNDDKLNFDTKDVDNANENYGSASAWFPKLLLDECPALWRGIALLSRRADPSAEHPADLVGLGL